MKYYTREKPNKKRIWEIDALRGLGMLGVIAIHVTYDLIYLFGLWQPKSTALFDFGQDWGGIFFLFLSGICVTLGSRSAKRGITVFGCGMVITAVTVGMYLLDFADRGIIIYFGVLHCLGVCMLLWQLFRKCPTWLLVVLGVVFAGVGLYWKYTDLRIATDWFTILGLPSYHFSSSDYFPLLPNFGYFLIGSVLGRTLYKKKESLLPHVNTENIILRVLCWIGRHSLLVYLVHQPLIAAILAVIAML